MARNRNRVPKFVHLSKAQYLHEKNIPIQIPLPQNPPEIDPYHHTSIITLNPFSKEIVFQATDKKSALNKESLTNNTNANTEQSIQKIIKSNKILINKEIDSPKFFKEIKSPIEKKNNEDYGSPIKIKEQSPRLANEEFPNEIDESDFQQVQSSQRKLIADQSNKNYSPANSPLNLSQKDKNSPKLSNNQIITPKALWNLSHKEQESPKILNKPKSPLNLRKIDQKSPKGSTVLFQSSPSNLIQKKTLQQESFPLNKPFPNPKKKPPQLSKSFDFSQTSILSPQNPKSPSRFSPSHKQIVKDVSKASAELFDKIESSPHYKRNFNTKDKCAQSEFELKAEIIELKDALTIENERLQQLETENEYLKTNEEELQTKIMDYQDTCESMTGGIYEIKSLQETLGKEILRLQDLEKIHQNMKDLEAEIQEILKDSENNEKLLEERNYLQENCENMKKEVEEIKKKYQKEKENQEKVKDSIKLLEEEIGELQKNKVFSGLEDDKVKEKDPFSREKNNWSSPKIKSSRSENIYSSGKSPWDKSRLLEMFEKFFDSKVAKFDIILEKPL